MTLAEQYMYRYPFSISVETGVLSNCEYAIVPHPSHSYSIPGNFNGYVIFPKRLTIESGYNGILAYIPVHGGITYCNEFPEGPMVYGFDTGHCDSEEYPIRDMSWIKEQCILMRDAIIRVSKIESQYIEAEKLSIANRNSVRADLLQPILDLATNPSFNFGLAIKFLSGSL